MSEELRPTTRRELVLSATWSFVKLMFASAIWIIAALGVAFPVQLLSGDFNGLFQDFLTPQQGHAVALLVLLLFDFLIVGCLNELRILGNLRRRVLLLLGSITVYVLVAIFAPLKASDLFQANAVLLGIFALAVFGIPRGLAYGPMERADAV